MKILGSSVIDAPRDQVWAALNDIEVLARIIPGCERLAQTGENEYEGVIKIGLQAIRGTYSGRVRIEDIRPPQHYRMLASGRSPSGIVDGAGTVDLDEQDGGTLLRYGGEAQIGGTLAGVGQRLIEGAARQLINQSLKALAEQIKARAVAPDASAAADAPAPGAPEPEGAAPPPPEPDAAPAPALRSVVVPEHEQLRPEALVRGIVGDLLGQRPWLGWVALAFVLGFLLGRARRG